jgi:hypothetical protein
VNREKIQDSAEKASGFTLGLVMWLCTGGLMTVHVVSWLLGATSLILTAIGMFIPPVGLINALVFIFTGDSLEQYF